MNWFEHQRLYWITEALLVYGFINREHLQRKFGISQAQASKDLQRYQKLHPDAMVYDVNAKCYKTADSFPAPFTPPKTHSNH